jgi:hypothetical protein
MQGRSLMITFEQVYEAVVKRHSEDDLNAMGHRKLADEIYQEFQRLNGKDPLVTKSNEEKPI